MTFPIAPHLPATPAQSADAAFQALQAYSSATASTSTPVATSDASREALIDSVTKAVNAYYTADTGKTAVDVKDPRYSAAKAQVASRLEADVAQQMAGSTSAPTRINGLDGVLNALQPGQENLNEALQQFLPNESLSQLGREIGALAGTVARALEAQKAGEGLKHLSPEPTGPDAAPRAHPSAI
jgi:DNA-binding protein Fis